MFAKVDSDTNHTIETIRIRQFCVRSFLNRSVQLGKSSMLMDAIETANSVGVFQTSNTTPPAQSRRRVDIQQRKLSEKHDDPHFPSLSDSSRSSKVTIAL